MAWTWQQAEQIAAAHMRDTLFIEDATVTASGPDGGIDVRGRDAAAQVKNWLARIGSPEVQKLRGAAHSLQYVCFYSFGGYTRSAFAAAEQLGVALYTFDGLGQVAPANELGERLQTLAFERSQAQVKIREDLAIAHLRWLDVVALWTALTGAQSAIEKGTLSAPPELIPQLSRSEGTVRGILRASAIRYQGIVARKRADDALDLTAQIVEPARKLRERYSSHPGGFGPRFDALLGAASAYLREHPDDNLKWTRIPNLNTPANPPRRRWFRREK